MYGRIPLGHAQPTVERARAPPFSGLHTGPRAFRTEVCFYWYHRGFCRPKGIGGQPGRCIFRHNLDVPNLQVRLPPLHSDHNPHCDLTLCPLQSNRGHEGTPEMSIDSGPNIKGELYSQPGLDNNPPGQAQSSSPRDRISEARSLVKGPKFTGRNGSSFLPKLSGKNRTRFKAQKKRVLQWQKDQNIEQQDIAERSLVYQERQTHQKQRRKRKEAMRLRNRAHPGIKIEENDSSDFDADLNPEPIRRSSKRGFSRTSRLMKIYERSVACDDKAKLFPETEQGGQPFEPILEGFEDWAPPTQTGGLREHLGQASTDIAMERGGVGVEETGLGPMISDHSASSVHQSLPVRAKIVSQPVPSNGRPRVLVDYELPEGEDRLEWDTDRVRRAFGEIE